MAEVSLSPGAAARRLGLAPETLRSWHRRYGIGPSLRSPGGHRRYTGTDLARLARMCALISDGTAPAAAAQIAGAAPEQPPTAPDRSPASAGRPGGHTLPVGESGPSCQGLARAAMRLDASAVDRLLAQSLAERGAAATWQHLAMPVLHGVGAKWSRSRRYVEVEHLLSWSISAALHRNAAAPPSPAGRRGVLLACVPDELHTLPMEALAAALSEQGRAPLMLGASAPAAAVVSVIRRTAPRALVLWSLAEQPAAMAALRAVAEAVAESDRRRETTTAFTAGPGWPAACRSGPYHLGSLPAAVSALSPDARTDAW